ncbi:hypothetical protein M0R45_019989 [Rubus argutus]|uniref:IBH1-like N-terminal domain-containing protein n=1 Tax=Rubus argutus TaxID=59490 RepID=A0AAW1X7X4_RUBAR
MSSSTTTTTSGVTLNPKSCRIKFARRFLRSLAQIKKQKLPSSSSSEEEIRMRSKGIKMAAYYSMARAVGPRMNWSRAFLFKLRNRVRHPKLVKRRRRKGLLEETAHYITCLSTQVKVMQAIADHLSK